MNLFENIKIINIHSAVNVPVVQNEIKNISNRSWYGLSFAKAGKIIYHHGGEEYLSDKEHIIFMPQNATYFLECKQTGIFPVINFLCSPDFVQKDFCSIKIEDPEKLLHCCARLEQALMFRSNGSKNKAFSVLYDIFYQIEAQNSSNNGGYCQLKPVICAIEEGYADPQLSNAVLAQCANISEVYLRKLFNKVYGCSPHKYLQKIRIKKAQSMLIDRTFSVTQISAKTGFSSVYHFCRAFKSETGYTPTQYRQHNFEYM